MRRGAGWMWFTVEDGGWVVVHCGSWLGLPGHEQASATVVRVRFLYFFDDHAVRPFAETASVGCTRVDAEARVIGLPRKLGPVAPGRTSS